MNLTESKRKRELLHHEISEEVSNNDLENVAPKYWSLERKKQWLRRYGVCQKEFQAYTEEIEVIEASTRKLTRLLTGMPTGNLISKPEDRWADMLNYRDEIIDYLTLVAGDQVKILEQVTEAIENLQNGIQQWILTQRYIQGKSFTEIAETSGYSERAVFKIHRQALENLIPIVN